MSTLGEAFESLLSALDRAEIRFLVGGSVASSVHGLPRQTNDIDILAVIDEAQAGELATVLRPDFYVDEDAIRTGRAFNVIHLQGAFKFDIFPVVDEFGASEIARRRWTRSPIAGLEQVEFPVASPEDTILAKLVWYRKGAESSERQWHDILGVLRIQTSRLEIEYLKTWAERLGVGDLLIRAGLS